MRGVGVIIRIEARWRVTPQGQRIQISASDQSKRLARQSCVRIIVHQLNQPMDGVRVTKQAAGTDRKPAAAFGLRERTDPRTRSLGVERLYEKGQQLVGSSNGFGGAASQRRIRLLVSHQRKGAGCGTTHLKIGIRQGKTDLSDKVDALERTGKEERRRTHGRGLVGDEASHGAPWECSPFYEDAERKDAMCGQGRCQQACADGFGHGPRLPGQRARQGCSQPVLRCSQCAQPRKLSQVAMCASQPGQDEQVTRIALLVGLLRDLCTYSSCDPQCFKMRDQSFIQTPQMNEIKVRCMGGLRPRSP